jgi:hypothetical protein
MLARFLRGRKPVSQSIMYSNRSLSVKSDAVGILFIVTWIHLFFVLLRPPIAYPSSVAWRIENHGFAIPQLGDSVIDLAKKNSLDVTHRE